MVPEEGTLACWQEKIVWTLRIDYGRPVAEYCFGRCPKDLPYSVRAIGKRPCTHQAIHILTAGSLSRLLSAGWKPSVTFAVGYSVGWPQ